MLPLPSPSNECKGSSENSLLVRRSGEKNFPSESTDRLVLASPRIRRLEAQATKQLAAKVHEIASEPGIVGAKSSLGVDFTQDEPVLGGK